MKKISGRYIFLLIFLLILLNPLIFYKIRYAKASTIIMSGNWEVSGNEIRVNEEIILNGNLTIREGGNLTLNYVHLLLNSSYDGEFCIRVENNSGLYIYNSIISAFNNDLEYNFWYLWGSKGIIDNSTIEELSGPRIHHLDLDKYGCPEGEDCEGSEGLFIAANNFIIKDCIIQNSNRNGIYVKGRNVSIYNSIIRNNFFEQINIESEVDDNGNIVYLASAQIFNNDISGSEDSNGIDISYAEVLIFNNTIHNNEFNGIEAVNSNVTIYNNILNNNEDNGINVRVNSSLIAYDNRITNTFNSDSKYFGSGYAFWLDYNLNKYFHIFNNYIENNIGGIAIHATSNVLIKNNTFVGHETAILIDNWVSFFTKEYIPFSSINITIKNNNFINNFIPFDIGSDTEVILINNSISGFYIPLKYSWPFILMGITIPSLLILIYIYKKKVKKKKSFSFTNNSLITNFHFFLQFKKP